MQYKRVIVIGAGVAGLASAAALALTHDHPVVSQAFGSSVHMIVGPFHLFRPAVLGRVVLRELTLLKSLRPVHKNIAPWLAPKTGANYQMSGAHKRSL